MSLVIVKPVLLDTEPTLINSCCTESPWTCVPGMESIGRHSTEMSVLPKVSSPKVYLKSAAHLQSLLVLILLYVSGYHVKLA